jgi:hypothetical protein
MNHDFSKAKVGDWACTARDGWAKILIIAVSYEFRINICNRWYSNTGVYSEDMHTTAFLKPPDFYNAGPKPCNFVKGQRVLTSNGSVNPHSKRYFSHELGGQYCCFIDGCDEWSSAGTTIPWDNCIAYEE